MTTRRQRTADNLCVIAVISWFRPANGWIPFRMLFALGTSILGDSASDNMVFTQGRGFLLGASFGLKHRSLRCRVLVCSAADTASLATCFLFGKLFAVAITFGFGEKRCRKNLPLSGIDQ